MSMTNLPLLLIPIGVGIVAGWLAGLVTRGRGFGLLGNIIAATFGAFAAIYILTQMGIVSHTASAEISIIAVIGAFFTLAFIGWVRR